MLYNILHEARIKCPKCKKQTLEYVESVRWWVCPDHLKCGFGVEEENLFKKSQIKMKLDKFKV